MNDKTMCVACGRPVAEAPDGWTEVQCEGVGRLICVGCISDGWPMLRSGYVVLDRLSGEFLTDYPLRRWSRFGFDAAVFATVEAAVERAHALPASEEREEAVVVDIWEVEDAWPGTFEDGGCVGWPSPDGARAKRVIPKREGLS